MYENILAQKKEIGRQQKLYEEQQNLLQEERQRGLDAISQAELALFEQTETQFQPSMMSAATDIGDGKRLMDGKVYKMVKTEDGTVYQYDKEENRRKALEAAEATKAPTKEMLASKNKALPSFWIPSLTPDAKLVVVQAPKLETMCTATETPHSVSIKKLIDVKFTSAKGDPTQLVCPACLKTLTNGSKIVVLKNCGHVLCKGCCGKFVRPTHKCHICDTRCKDRDIIQFNGEGTGFSSGGGKVESSKTTVAFQ
ncbi:hypothetical protein PhCBS80983_g00261 [Powellomyces hirtus]|uniref:RING-type domain-containing protein n=1 Tax=Powellomyces hirtus TaxID=109895 RepID=A0A507EGV9_9FUNG|nr:hypothetical protein PhCBS80983_g00261 [Powellomyces hirtus]